MPKRLLLAAAAVYAALFGLMLFIGQSHAHDIYSNLYSDGRQGSSPGTHWCCNGDPEHGDCEAIGTNYRVLENGDAVFESKRYGRKVLVARDKVLWMPVQDGEASEAHWCGKPRAMMVNPPPLSEDQPDPATWTYCAFIAPGGV